MAFNWTNNLQSRLFERESVMANNYEKFQHNLFQERLKIAKNLYKYDLVAHYGCVNAIEFSNGGEYLISGGDDKRVLFWNVEKSIAGYDKPRAMDKEHQSNIFCLGFNKDNSRIFSGGNDDLAIVHDTQTGKVIDVYIHQKPVYGLSVDPTDDNIISTAGEDGRVLIFDQRKCAAVLTIGKYRAPFHAVQFHPFDGNYIVTANSKKGAAFWDIRKPQSPVVQYGGEGNHQSCMSVRFNTNGNQVLALRRRLPPILYNTSSDKPVCQFYHPDYYNSCTMKSCCFAGEDDEFVLSGSDDFNLYVWRVGDIDLDLNDQWIEQTQMVLYGHRSIVNQVRYNPQKCVLASSGVEKIVKLWSPFEQKGWVGTLTQEANGPENPREVFSHDAYFSLMHMNWSNMTHDYSNQNTNEDPRMMAFFDSLIQQEIEGWNTNDSSDSDQCSVGTSENSTRQSSTESSEDEDAMNMVNYVLRDPRGRNQRGNLNSTVKPQRNKYANRIAYLIATKRNTLRRLALKGQSQSNRQRQNAVLKSTKRKNNHHHHHSHHNGANSGINKRSNLRTSRSGSSAKRCGRFNSLSNRQSTRLRDQGNDREQRTNGEANESKNSSRYKTHIPLFRSFRRKNRNYRLNDHREESSSDNNSSQSDSDDDGNGDRQQQEQNGNTNQAVASTSSSGAFNNLAIPSTSTGITSNGKEFRLRQHHQQQNDDDSDADDTPINSDAEPYTPRQQSLIVPTRTTVLNGIHKNAASSSTTASATETSPINNSPLVVKKNNNNNNNSDTSSDIDDLIPSPINRRKRPASSTIMAVRKDASTSVVPGSRVGDLDVYSSHSNSRLSNSSYLEDDDHDSLSSNESLDCFNKKRKIVPNNSNNNNNNSSKVNNNTNKNKNTNDNSNNTKDCTNDENDNNSSLTQVSATEENPISVPLAETPNNKISNGFSKINNFHYDCKTPDSGISSIATTPNCSSASHSSTLLLNSANCSETNGISRSNCNLKNYNNSNSNHATASPSSCNNAENSKFAIKLFQQKVARVRKSYRQKFGDDSDSD